MKDDALQILQEIANLLYHILDHLTADIAKQRDGEQTWLDNQDVMQLLHISERTLCRWRREGALQYVKVNGKIWYRQVDVDKFLSN